MEPWYKRSEFWLALLSLIQPIILSFFPHVPDALQVGAATAAAAVPTTYVAGRAVIKNNFVKFVKKIDG